MKKMSTNEMRNDRRRNRSKRNNIAHPSRPRLVVYRSNKHISAQVINDHDGNTLASASSLDKTIEKLVIKAKSKIDVSILVGKTLAERALKNKDSLFKWLYDIHNKVNLKLRKQNLTKKKDPSLNKIKNFYKIYTNKKTLSCDDMPGFTFIYSIAFNYPLNKDEFKTKTRFNKHKIFLNIVLT